MIIRLCVWLCVAVCLLNWSKAQEVVQSVDDARKHSAERLEDSFAVTYGKPGCIGAHQAIVVRSDVIIGEPVLVSMIISNEQRTSIQTPYADDNWRGRKSYYVFHSRDRASYSRLWWGGAVLQIDPKFVSRTLGADEAWRRDILVLYDYDYKRIVFQEGTNWIRIAHVCGWRSAPLEVVVGKPQHADDVIASRLMSELEIAAFICSDSDLEDTKVNSTICKDVETVANGKGRLAPYAALRLATYCFESQQMTDALKWAKMADVDGFVMQDKAVFLQAKSCLKLQDIERGSNLFARIRRDFPYSESACKLRYEEESLLAETERAVKEQRKAEGVRNEAARWKDVPAATRKEIEQTVDTLMKMFMTLDERGSSGMMTDNFVMNGHWTKAQLLERFRRELKEAKEKLPIVSTVFEQVVTDGSNVMAQMEFTFRSERGERKKRDRMTFVQKGNKGVWLLAIWDSTPVDSPEMKKWEEEVVRMTIEGKTNGFPERPRPK